MGILILPPDINESKSDFTVVPQGIRFGLAAIKNVGSAAVDSILATRSQQGLFSSFPQFCQTVDLRKANKRVLEGLLKAGAFDFGKVRRSTLIDQLEQIMLASEKARKAAETKQSSLFGNGGSESPVPSNLPSDTGKTEGPGEATAEVEDQIARMEKEVLGFYITSHPLSRYEAEMKEKNAVPTELLETLEEGEKTVCICGVPGEVRVTRTKRGEAMAYLRLEDLTGSVEVIVFPDLYRVAAPYLTEEKPLVVTGTLDRTEHGVKLKALTLTRLGKGGLRATMPRSPLTPPIETSSLTLLLPETTRSATVKELEAVLRGAPGTIPVTLKITLPGQPVVIDTRLKVSDSPALIDRLKELLGEDAVLGSSPLS
jgi:DNA polymerase-3 subunit alpha